MGKSIKIIACVCAAILVALGVTIFLAWYSNGWESFKPVYIKYDGKKAASISVESGGLACVQVCAAGFNKKAGEYTVQILPNAEADFDYTVDGRHYRFSASGDLTEIFEVNLYGEYFTFKCKSVSRALETLHGASVNIIEKLDKGESYFTVLVTSRNKVIAAIPLNIKSEIEVELSPDEVIFYED